MDRKSQLHTPAALTLGKKTFVANSYGAVWAPKIDAEKAILNIEKLVKILLLLISAFIIRIQLILVHNTVLHS